VIEHVQGSLDFFNIVFFAVLLSTLLQGATFEPLARRLGVTSDDSPVLDDRPPRRARASAQISSSRAWSEQDGDPAYPKRVGEIEVSHQLVTRLDRPGALVALEDGRYAFTGPVVAVGSASALQAAARRRLERAGSDDERAWWREVIGQLAH
jgi:hypothetical protein